MIRRRFLQLDYRWRLFVPLVGVLWLVILIVSIYLYNKESDYRKEAVFNEIRFLNARIVSGYEQNADIRPFFRFASKYYANSALNGIRISVYNDQGKLLSCIGVPIPRNAGGDLTPELKKAIDQGYGSSVRRSEVDGTHSYYYIGVQSTPDRKIFVHTALPYTDALSRSLSVSDGLVMLIIILAIAVTVIAYITTRILGRNVMVLHDFAAKAAAGEPLPPIDDLPHNELGDISRQIVKLYTEKDAAMMRSEREHSIAIKATEDKINVTRELSNNINHELKTPVGVIRGYLDTIATHPEMPDEMKQRFIDNARNAVDRLCILLNDLSSITRLEDGGNTIERESVDFNDLLYNISSELEAVNLSNGIKFTYELGDQCYVEGNYNLLYGMIMNLIRNADFHSRGDSCTLKLIHTTAREYTFSFADNGVGVEPQHLDHLFDRFYRIDKGRSRKVGGTGLGLPIVKNTVTVFGGTIIVRNATPHGLEFVFTLLRAPEAPL